MCYPACITPSPIGLSLLASNWWLYYLRGKESGTGRGKESGTGRGKEVRPLAVRLILNYIHPLCLHTICLFCGPFVSLLLAIGVLVYSAVNKPPLVSTKDSSERPAVFTHISLSPKLTFGIGSANSCIETEQEKVDRYISIYNIHLYIYYIYTYTSLYILYIYIYISLYIIYIHLYIFLNWCIVSLVCSIIGSHWIGEMQCSYGNL